MNSGGIQDLSSLEYWRIKGDVGGALGAEVHAAAWVSLICSHITEAPTHQVLLVGRDICVSQAQPSQPDEIAQHLVQLSSEYLQGWRSHNLVVQYLTTRMLENVLPNI